MPLPDTLTVQIDTREKYPILFPSTLRVEDSDPRRLHTIQIKTERVALSCGDYRLAEFPALCIIERKAGQSELMKNLLDIKDYIRQTASFAKLSGACNHPVLLLECTPSDLLTPSSSSKLSQIMHPTQENVDLLMTRLFVVAAHFGFHLLFTGHCYSVSSRRNLGTLLLNMMTGYAIRGSKSGGVGSGIRSDPSSSFKLMETAHA